ncbi:MAG: PAS domain S-box protein [Dissulfurispiraceae bacterium]
MKAEPGEHRNLFDKTSFSEQSDVLNIILDHITHGMVVVGPDYRMLAFNRHFEEMFQLPDGTVEVGVDFREILKTWAEVTGQDQQMLDRAIIHLDEPATFQVEFPQLINGEPRWCLLTHNPLPGKGFVRTFTDITERKRGENALRESEERLRVIFETSQAGIMLGDQNGTLIFTNRRMADMLGFSIDEVIGSSYGNYIHPDDLDESIRKMGCLISGDLKTVAGERHYIRKDGSSFWGYVTAQRLEDTQGKLTGLVGVITDITEAKNVEEDLRNSEQRFRGIIESLQDVYYRSDAEGRLTMVSPSGIILLGYYSLEEVLGWNIRDTFYYDAVERDALVGELREKGKVNNYEVTLRRKDGTPVPVAASSHLLFDRNGQYAGIEGVFRDMSEYKQLQDEIIRSQKLESLGLLAGGIAHDFNNLLTGIMGNISLVKINLDTEHKDYARLSAAETAAKRATDLTQQLLTFAKGGAPIKKALPIAELIRESVDFALSGSNISCNYIISDGLWNTEADRGQMAQVFNNLSINAMHAMPEGGRVNVKMENLTLSANIVSTLPAGDYIKIVFSDSGTGISSEHLSKIFDPYFTTKTRGSGLGLATVFSILKKHGGHITVESEDGAGTTFTIYLPATREDAHPDNSEKDTLTKGYGNILVMDDEELVRETAGGMLTMLGFQVQFTEDGEKAVALYKKSLQEKNPFLVLIMDLTIPGGMGGKEAVAKILEMDPEAKAIASSGYSTDPVMSEFKKYGFAGVITKPYRIQQMSEAISKVLSL